MPHPPVHARPADAQLQHTPTTLQVFGALREDGMVVAAGGGVVVGRRDPKDGAIYAPMPGDVLHPDTVAWADGTVLTQGGRYLGQRRPDGTVVDPRGVVLGGLLEGENAIRYLGSSAGSSATLLVSRQTVAPETAVPSGAAVQPPRDELYNEDADTVSRYPWHEGRRFAGERNEHVWISTNDPKMRAWANDVAHHRA